MAWTREGVIPLVLPATPSLRSNNLTTCDAFAAYSHADEVVVARISGGESVRVNLREPDRVTAVQYVLVADRYYLVITSKTGMQVWNDEGTQMLHVYAIREEFGAGAEEAELDEMFMKGVCELPGQPSFCVGCSTGDLVVCDLFTTGEPSVDKTRTVTTGSDSAISCVHASTRYAACGCDDGTVAVHDLRDDFSRQCSFPGDGVPVMGIAVRGRTVIAGNATGHLRVYQAHLSELSVEVTAHTRCVMALDLHPAQPLVVTAGEDQYLHVWDLPDFESQGSTELALLYSDTVPNRLITGVQFLRDGSHGIVACAYDWTTAPQWTRT